MTVLPPEGFPFCVIRFHRAPRALSDDGHVSRCRYAVTRGTFPLISQVWEEVDVHDQGSTRDSAQVANTATCGGDRSRREDLPLFRDRSIQLIPMVSRLCGARRSWPYQRASRSRWHAKRTQRQREEKVLHLRSKDHLSPMQIVWHLDRHHD